MRARYPSPRAFRENGADPMLQAVFGFAWGRVASAG